MEQEGFPLLKRYDVADRGRRLVDLLAVFNFTSDFSIDYSGSYRNDDYPDTRFGLVDDSTRHHVLGVSFAPFSPCTVRIETASDFATRRLNARLRPLFFGGEIIELGANNWSDEISEKGSTISAEAQCFPEDATWDLGFGLVQTTDRQTDDTAAPHTYINPNFEGDAEPYPPTKRSFRQTHARARFRLTRTFDLILKAAFEEFEEADPTQDVMNAPMGRIDGRAFESAYLGVSVDSYSAAIFDVFLGVHW